MISVIYSVISDFFIHKSYSMVIESSQQPAKRGRGRPRKTPAPVAPSHKEPSKETKKVTKSQSTLSREEELAAFENRSNKSGILTLLVLLLWIALIGYGMYLKLHQADKLDDDMPVNPAPVVKETPDVPEKPTEQKPTPTVSNTIVQEYFARINNWKIDTLAPLQDTSFRTLATLRNYFNTRRLETFSKNTVWGIRIESFVENTTDPALQRNPALSPKAYDFTMVYKLSSDQKEYRDAWRAYVVQKSTGTVINWFVYLGTWVAESPFFQFTKFGIK